MRGARSVGAAVGVLEASAAISVSDPSGGRAPADAASPGAWRQAWRGGPGRADA